MNVIIIIALQVSLYGICGKIWKMALILEQQTKSLVRFVY